jgi:hypothetical protein
MELTDFFVNAAVCLETAAPTESNVRLTIGMIVSSLALRDPSLIEMILRYPPSEETTFLLTCAATPMLEEKLQSQIYEWATACQPENLAQSATHLRLLAQLSFLLSDEVMAGLQETVIAAVLSDCIVVSVSSIGLAYEMLERQMTFPMEVLVRAVEMIPSYPTEEAVRLLQQFLRFQTNDTVSHSFNVFLNRTSIACPRVLPK